MTAVDAEEVIETLAEDIGCRFGGSDGEHEAARYLQGVCETLKLDTHVQSFTYTGWELIEEPTLEIVEPVEETLDVQPLLWSAGTDGRIEGSIKRVGRKSLIPGLNGYELPLYEFNDEAEIIACEEDHAIPLINPRPLYQTPQFVISEPAQERIEALLEDHDKVCVAGDVSVSRSPTTSYNVIGKYRPDAPVNSSETLLVGAHYDTTINTPGAYDNASGVGAVAEVAAKVIENELPVNVDFVFFACEENGILGSQEYVTQLRERPHMDISRAIILDMMSGGEEFSIWVDPEHEDFSETLTEAAKEAGIDQDAIELTPQKPGSDGWPLHEMGVPTTTLLWWKLNEIYHTPRDTMDLVEGTKLDQTIDSVFAVLQREVE